MAAGEPQHLGEFVGQPSAKAMVEIACKYAYKAHELPHILITGNAGHGKTTLAKLIALSVKAPIISVTAHSIDSRDELTNYICDTLQIWSNGKEYTAAPVLFIDEIHALDKKVMECLYVPMQEQMLDINGGRQKILPFTVIGATTEGGTLTEPLIERFAMHLSLEPYTVQDIANILWHRKMTEWETCCEIARRSRRTPRIGIQHLRMASAIDFDLVTYFKLAQIDEYGFGTKDYRILDALVRAERPCSTKAIAKMTAINETEIISMLEPYLVTMKFISLTARGRQITAKGRNYIECITRQQVIET